MRRVIYFLLLILLGVVPGACRSSLDNGEDGAATPTGRAGTDTSVPATASPTLPVTIVRKMTPLPSATLGADPSPTPVPTNTKNGCEYTYFFDPAPGLCPITEPVVSVAAEQPFENGVMIWLEATDSIYVFTKDQRWRRFDDTWSEEQAESDPTIIPPDGRYQPIRGFGKIWRTNPVVRDQLGWAVGVELGFESKIQDQVTPSGGDKVTFLLTYNGQVFALTARGDDEGDWVIAAS